MSLRLSVVIPTRNRKNVLERLLRSLERQTLAKDQFEVIVVDDGSSDGTPAEVEAFAGQSPLQVRCVANPERGTGAARNYGVTQARGGIVAFMDDDVTLREDCIANALAHFDNEPIAAVEAQLLIEGTQRPLLKSSFAQGFITNAIFYRRQVLLEIGGFDDAFFDRRSGMFFRDDLDLGFRLLEAGHTAIQPADVVAWHPFIYPDLRSCFAHARRYMMDPLLYRKHPARFRSLLERKRIGPLSFGRPMHYACMAHCVSILGIALSLATRLPLAAAVGAAAAIATHFVVRFKFQGPRALHFWDLRAILAFAALPWWYAYWFIRGCIRFGGWRSIV